MGNNVDRNKLAGYNYIMLFRDNNLELISYLKLFYEGEDNMFESIKSFFMMDANNLDIKKFIIVQGIIFLSAVFSVITTIRSDHRAKKNTFINTTTSNRIKWMQELKCFINDYITLTQLSENATIYYDMQKRLEYFERLTIIRNKIVLHLNCQGYIDEKIIMSIRKIYTYIEILYEMDKLLQEDDNDKKVEYIIKHYQSEIFSELTSAIDLNNIGDIEESIEQGDVSEIVSRIIRDKIEEFNSNFKKLPRIITRRMEKEHNELIKVSKV
jgi:hypothetical protein